MRPKLASTLRKLSLLSVLPLGAALPAHAESDEGITWLATYKAGALPAAPQWTWHGDDRDNTRAGKGLLGGSTATSPGDSRRE
jgi:hypothetical protein